MLGTPEEGERTRRRLLQNLNLLVFAQEKGRREAGPEEKRGKKKKEFLLSL